MADLLLFVSFLVLFRDSRSDIQHHVLLFGVICVDMCGCQDPRLDEEGCDQGQGQNDDGELSDVSET
jgi:hypothetical protein